MNTELKVRIKNNYGTYHYYPENDQAEMLAHIAGTETLTPQTLKLATDMGFIITYTHTIPEDGLPT